MLVGLPGAGKTTVGQLVAASLGARFADFDRLIEARAGKSVARIFADEGEAAFRALEAAVGAEQLASAAAVLSPGGGYLADPGRRAEALRLAHVVYLEVSPAVAAERLRGAGGRPLLEGAEPVARLAELLRQREAGYLSAQGRVSTDGLSVLEVAQRVVELARSGGGW